MLFAKNVFYLVQLPRQSLCEVALVLGSLAPTPAVADLGIYHMMLVCFSHLNCRVTEAVAQISRGT